MKAARGTAHWDEHRALLAQISHYLYVVLATARFGDFLDQALRFGRRQLLSGHCVSPSLGNKISAKWQSGQTVWAAAYLRKSQTSLLRLLCDRLSCVNKQKASNDVQADVQTLVLSPLTTARRKYALNSPPDSCSIGSPSPVASSWCAKPLVKQFLITS